jgi:hypothetical protein
VKDTNLIPYDATAFLMEVKKVVDKDSLEADLQKLKNVKKMGLYNNRFGDMIMGLPFFVTHPLMNLFYFEQGTNTQLIENILGNNSEFWDTAFILYNHEGQADVAINKRLPVAKVLSEVVYKAKMNTDTVPEEIKRQKFLWYTDVPFIILFQVILASIPSPIAVDVMPTIMNIAAYAFKNSSS